MDNSVERKIYALSKVVQTLLIIMSETLSFNSITINFPTLLRFVRIYVDYYSMMNCGG